MPGEEASRTAAGETVVAVCGAVGSDVIGNVVAPLARGCVAPVAPASPATFPAALLWAKLGRFGFAYRSAATVAGSVMGVIPGNAGGAVEVREEP